ncbi:MAG: hypothetical protein JWN78_1613 [Bacteroidota bacterium]|nr:hypothetical protein [Bacteroidota bacterium]
MKILINSLFGILSFCLAILSAHMYHQGALSDSETVVFVDLTDKQLNEIRGRDLFDYSLVENHIWSRHTVYFESLTNFNYSSIQKVQLDKKFMFLSNPNKRKREIMAFGNKLDSALQSLYTIDTGFDNSCVYEPIVRENNRLSKVKATSRTIIICSDLQENSDLFSVYNRKDIEEIQNNPDKIIARFENKLKPENLTGIHIYINYLPRDYFDNERFIEMSGIIKKIFESHGATVKIGPTLVYQ